MSFLHSDHNEDLFTLHDCRATKVCLQGQNLMFEFPDGFGVLPDHPENSLSDVARTDSARIEYTLVNGDAYYVTVWVFERSRFGKTVRKEWTVEKLADKIDRGIYQLEFLSRFHQGNHDTLFLCDLISDKKPFFRECLIRITHLKATYSWNRLLLDKPW